MYRPKFQHNASDCEKCSERAVLYVQRVQDHKILGCPTTNCEINGKYFGLGPWRIPLSGQQKHTTENSGLGPGEEL